MGTINFKGCEVLDDLSLCMRFENETEEEYCWEGIKTDLDYFVRLEDNFSYFKIESEPGYYEGFEYIITFEHGWEYNYDYIETEEERQDIIKELKKLKQLVLSLIYNGMCLEAPGWCPTIFDYQDSKNRVEEIFNNHIKEVTEREIETEECE